MFHPPRLRFLTIENERKYPSQEPEREEESCKKTKSHRVVSDCPKDNDDRLLKIVVEPVFGMIKAARGFRQFLLRGCSMVSSEWSLVCTAHNLLKLAAACR